MSSRSNRSDPRRSAGYAGGAGGSSKPIKSGVSDIPSSSKSAADRGLDLHDEIEERRARKVTQQYSTITRSPLASKENPSKTKSTGKHSQAASPSTLHKIDSSKSKDDATPEDHHNMSRLGEALLHIISLTIQNTEEAKVERKAYVSEAAGHLSELRRISGTDAKGKPRYEPAHYPSLKAHFLLFLPGWQGWINENHLKAALKLVVPKVREKYGIEVPLGEFDGT